ncbi:DUF6538 domain-containing protein [Solidesulfovibrio aerotolerans]|uniref:DUF6538 domain-containing protein n=1 Tax=Solidesulfovibrio aerotolerans TaxID=295255 RepID=UPI0034E07FC1
MFFLSNRLWLGFNKLRVFPCLPKGVKARGQTCHIAAWAAVVSQASTSLQSRREARSPPRPASRASRANSLPQGRSLRRSSPTYLYFKGNLYYFRYAFPKAYRDLLGHAEIRISLQTEYVREARNRASGLYAILLKLIEGGV